MHTNRTQSRDTRYTVQWQKLLPARVRLFRWPLYRKNWSESLLLLFYEGRASTGANLCIAVVCLVRTLTTHEFTCLISFLLSHTWYIQPTLVVRLRKPKSHKRVQWQEGVVDNEMMGKKKSKCERCCCSQGMCSILPSLSCEA